MTICAVVRINGSENIRSAESKAQSQRIKWQINSRDKCVH